MHLLRTTRDVEKLVLSALDEERPTPQWALRAAAAPLGVEGRDISAALDWLQCQKQVRQVRGGWLRGGTE